MTNFNTAQTAWLDLLDAASLPQGHTHMWWMDVDGKQRFCALGLAMQAVNPNHPAMLTPSPNNTRVSLLSELPIAEVEKLRLFGPTGPFALTDVSDLWVGHIKQNTIERGYEWGSERFGEDGRFSITRLNDKLSWSFHRIARFIREEHKAVFRDTEEIDV